MKIWRVLLVMMMAVSLAIGVSLPSSASPVIYEYWNTGGDANSIAIYGGEVVAEQFTSEATSHSVTSIRVELLRVGTPSSVTVALWNASAGVPTTEITSVTYTGTILSLSYTMYSFDITDQVLLPSTQYAIVVSCTAGDNANYVQWHQDSGGGLANAVGLHSHDSGISWTSDTPADYLFEIYGDVVFQVVGANVFQDYLVDGDWLIVIECINNYPEYYTSSIPSRYFNIQLLDVTGTNILAATTLKSWGYAPESIYLSPSSVTALTVGDAYIIRMIGTFTGAPSTSYTLQNTASQMDWQGSDLYYLDQWCLKVANRMHNYDYGVGVTTNPYTIGDSDGNNVISSIIQYKFTTGIIAIMDIRPNIFATIVLNPDYTIEPVNNAWDNLYTWQNQVGTTISSDATTFGGVFGITAKQFLSMGVWLIYIACMLFVFASNKGSETAFALVLCVPVLFIGLHFRLIEGYIIAMLAVFSLLLFLMKTWFNK